MKISSLPCALVLGAFLLSSGAVSPGAEYTENFLNTGATVLSLSNYGWNVNYGATATSFTNTSASNYDSATGMGSDGVGGYFSAASTAPGVGKNVLIWTNTASPGTFGTIDTLGSITFALNDATTENLQVALEIGSNWYVTTSVFNGSGWATQTMTLAGTTAWDSLSFTAGTLSLGGTVTLPTTGTINGIGFYDGLESSTVGAIRLDTIAVNAVPEPSPWTMAAGAGLLVLFLRARRRTAATVA